PLAGTARDKETWVADRDGRIVGFAVIDGGWLEHLYVHPSRFNTGTGAKLFRQAAMQHPQGFQLWVFQQDTGARRFFERQGCALVRLTDGQDNDEKLLVALYLWPGKKGCSASSARCWRARPGWAVSQPSRRRAALLPSEQWRSAVWPSARWRSAGRGSGGWRSTSWLSEKLVC